MPSIGRSKSASGRLSARAGPAARQRDHKDVELDALVVNCLAAHAIIGEHGTPAMRRLIDLSLFEIGCAIDDHVAGCGRGRGLN